MACSRIWRNQKGICSLTNDKGSSPLPTELLQMLHRQRKGDPTLVWFRLRMTVRSRSRESRPKFDQDHMRTEHWTHLRREPELCGWLAMDLLISMHCCCILLDHHGLLPSRDLSQCSAQCSGQWVNQAFQLLTTASTKHHVSLDESRRCGDCQVASAEPF